MSFIPNYNLSLHRWTPFQLSNLVSYYDASISGSLTLVVSGTDYAVDVWQDQSGRGNHLSASAAINRPLYRTVDIGTGPAIVGDGVNQWLRDSAVSFGTSMNYYTIHVVMKSITSTALNAILYYAGGNIRIRQTAAAYDHIGPGIVTSLSTTPSYFGQLFTAGMDGSNQSIYVDANRQDLDANTNAGPADGSILAVFANNLGTQVANESIAFLAIQAGAPSDDEMLKLRHYCVKQGWIRDWTFSAAESATILPNTVIWVSTEGLTLADADTTVDQWASSYGGGTACTLVAPTTAERPTYTAGTYPLLTFDGINNRMSGSTGLTLGGDHTENQWGWVGQRVAITTLGYPYMAYANRYSMADRTASTMYVSVGAGSVINLDDPDGNNQHWWGTRSQTAGNATVGHANITESTGSGLTIATYTDGQVPYIGGNSAGTTHTNIIMRAVYWSFALTEYQKAYLRALLTAKTGIAC